MLTKITVSVGALLVLTVSLALFGCRKDGRGSIRGDPVIEEKAYIVCDPNAVAPRMVLTLMQSPKFQSFGVIFVDKDNNAWSFRTSTPHIPSHWDVGRTDLNSASDTWKAAPLQEVDFKTLRERWSKWFPNAAER
jgi:hypothetical protein